MGEEGKRLKSENKLNFVKIVNESWMCQNYSLNFPSIHFKTSTTKKCLLIVPAIDLHCFHHFDQIWWFSFFSFQFGLVGFGMRLCCCYLLLLVVSFFHRIFSTLMLIWQIWHHHKYARTDDKEMVKVKMLSKCQSLYQSHC